jgi:hypothetical protein
MSENGQKWGQRASNPNAAWVKTRDLVGSAFDLIRCNAGQVKGRDSYIFEVSGDRLFSQGKDSTIGKQIGRDGIPPAGRYEIVKQTEDSHGQPIKSPTGYALVLRAL